MAAAAGVARDAGQRTEREVGEQPWSSFPRSTLTLLRHQQAQIRLETAKARLFHANFLAQLLPIFRVGLLLPLLLEVLNLDLQLANLVLQLANLVLKSGVLL